MNRGETKIIRSGEQPTMLLIPKSKLVVQAPEGVARDFIVDKGTITIGASDGSDLQLKDETVSRNHSR
jgi:pSer/pThr/pTyr-binding forkhead associated (FHA) protein